MGDGWVLRYFLRGGLPTGSYLWIGNYSTDRIYRSNYNNGSAYTYIPANHDMYGGIAVMATGDGGRSPTYMLSDDNSRKTPLLPFEFTSLPVRLILLQ